MNNKISKQTERVAHLLLDNVPKGFHEVWFCAEVQDSSYSCAVFYRDGEGRVFHPRETDKLSDALYKLWELYRKMGPAPWTGTVMHINSEGKFNMKLSYDSLKGPPLARKYEWLLETTGTDEPIYPDDDEED